MSLTDISVSSRKFFFYCIVGLICVIIVRVLLTSVISYWKSTHRPPPSPPTVAFGKLPHILFPSSAITSTNLSVTLQTVEGKPQMATSSAQVFTMPKKVPTFLSADKTQKLAEKLGFLQSPSIQTTYFTYEDIKEPYQLYVDSVTLNFKLRYNYQNDTRLFTETGLRSKDDAIQSVKNFISMYGLFDDSLLKGKITTTLLRYNQETKSLQEAPSLSESHAIRVDFFRNDIDGMKVLSSGFTESSTYAIYVASNHLSKPVIDMSYVFWPISFNKVATYPLKTSDVAWQEFLDGKATVMKRGNSQEVIIRKIYVAYYDSEEPQPFLQPIFVFEGDGGFAAYLSAITAEWTE